MIFIVLIQAHSMHADGNPKPDDKILSLSKLKAFADDKCNSKQ